MPRRDLSLDEQKRVLAYLNMLRTRLGSWTLVEQALPLSHSVRVEVTSGRSEISTAIAFRVAKVLDVSLYDVLAGTAHPPNTCPQCGHPIDG